MAIDPDRLLNWPFDPVAQRYDERDSMLYALSIGVGREPTDPAALRFVQERGLLAFPTMAAVLCRPGPWLADPRTGVDRGMTVHGEIGIDFASPLPPAGTMLARTRVTDVVDKGPGRGALILTAREIKVQETGEVVATVRSTSFARANGGFGGDPAVPRAPHALPDRSPDAVTEHVANRDAALLYRLNGDRNPLHSDPETARKAGYERPILHGLYTFAAAAHAVLARFAELDPTALRSIDARFSAHVFPGETISFEMWRNGAEISFRAFVRSRQAKVLDNGLAVLAGQLGG